MLARQRRRWRLGRPDFTSSRNLLGDISQENVTNMSFVPPLCCWLLSGLSGREQMAGQQEKISLFISLSSYSIRNICDAPSFLLLLFHLFSDTNCKPFVDMCVGKRKVLRDQSFSTLFGERSHLTGQCRRKFAIKF